MSTKSKGSQSEPVKGGHVLRPIGAAIKHVIGLITLVLVQFMDGMNMSGRIAGNVYQKNGIKRNFAAPPVFRTPAASRVKGLFTGLSVTFDGLTTATRLLWNSFGFKTTDRLSRVKSLSGKAAFIQLNSNLTNSGQPTIQVPYTISLPADPILGGVITADDSAHSLSLAYTPNVNDGQVLVFATEPLRPSILKPALSKFKLIGVFDGTTASPVNLVAEYNSVFGVNAVSGVDNNIWIDLVTINSNGQNSPAVRYVGSIVA